MKEELGVGKVRRERTRKERINKKRREKGIQEEKSVEIT